MFCCFSPGYGALREMAAVKRKQYCGRCIPILNDSTVLGFILFSSKIHLVICFLWYFTSKSFPEIIFEKRHIFNKMEHWLFAFCICQISTKCLLKFSQ